MCQLTLPKIRILAGVNSGRTGQQSGKSWKRNEIRISSHYNRIVRNGKSQAERKVRTPIGGV